MQRPLVRLVQDDARVLREERVLEALHQEEAVRHVLDEGAGRGHVLETDGVSDEAAQLCEKERERERV